MIRFGWSAHALPYLAVAVTLLLVAAWSAVLRGDRVLRLGMIGTVCCALPWALCSALSACTRDPETATHLLRLGNGATTLIGPNILIMLLAASGQLERYRLLVYVAVAIGALTIVVSSTTSLVVAGVTSMPSGLLYTRGGPLLVPHNAMMFVWTMIGLTIARRAVPGDGRRRRLRLVTAIAILAIVGLHDGLLSYGYGGNFPLAWVPAEIAGCITLYLVVVRNVLRGHGFDVRAAIGLASYVACCAGLIGVAYLLHRNGALTPLVLAAAGSPLGIAAVVVPWWLEGKTQMTGIESYDRDLAAFIERSASVDDERTLAADLTALWGAQAELARVELWVPSAGGLTTVTRDREWTTDPEVMRWLKGRGEPVLRGDLATMRLGGLRARIEQIFTTADLLVPLIDRDALIAVVAGWQRAPRSMRDAERRLISESAQATSHALSYIAMTREAALAAEATREVEIASAMRAQAAAGQRERVGAWWLEVDYQAAVRANSNGWSSARLPDGRLTLLALATEQRGVPGALMASAVIGAFAAAAREITAAAAAEIIEALDRAVASVGRGDHPVAALVVVFDEQRRSIDWASAGYPGAWIVSPRGSPPLPVGQAPQGPHSASRRGRVEPGADALDVVQDRAMEITTLGSTGRRLGERVGTIATDETTLPDDASVVILSESVWIRGAALAATEGRSPGIVSLLAQLASSSPLTPAALMLAMAPPSSDPGREDLLAIVVSSG